jgi:hypothetical protein
MAAFVIPSYTPSTPRSLSREPLELAPRTRVTSPTATADRRIWWVLVLLVATVATVAWWAPWGSGPATTTPPSAAAVAVAPGLAPSVAAPPPAATYTVRPGDTLWSIASTLRPGEDPRPVVDELAHRAGGGTLQPGQQISVDGIS